MILLDTPADLTYDEPMRKVEITWTEIHEYSGASVPAEGVLIRCSECGAVARVYHFDWTAFTCNNC